MIHTFRTSQFLECSIEEAWTFFSTAGNLVRITPPSMKFKVLTEVSDQEIYEGMIIDYQVSPLFGIRMNWKTEITEVIFQKSFTDFQLSGPYKLWNHRHVFTPKDNGVLMEDTIDYEVPFGFLGEIAQKLIVGRKVAAIFDYRCKILDEMFNSGKARG